MHAALRVVSVERGFDPRDFGLIAFGGAGPLHANALGRLIDAEPVVIPTAPGVLSAFGFQAAEVQNEFARTYLRSPRTRPRTTCAACSTSLRDEAGEWLDARGRGRGQANVPTSTPTAATSDAGHPAAVRAAGRGRSTTATPSGSARSSRTSTGAATASTWTHRSRSPRCAWSAPGTDHRRGGRAGCRQGRLGGRPRARRAGVLRRRVARHRRSTTATRSAPVTRSSGPAIVVQQDTTTVIEPGYAGTVDDYGNLIIRKLEGNR